MPLMSCWTKTSMPRALIRRPPRSADIRQVEVYQAPGCPATAEPVSLCPMGTTGRAGRQGRAGIKVPAPRCPGRKKHGDKQECRYMLLGCSACRFRFCRLSGRRRTELTPDAVTAAVRPSRSAGFSIATRAISGEAVHQRPTLMCAVHATVDLIRVSAFALFFAAMAPGRSRPRAVFSPSAAGRAGRAISAS